MSERTEMSERNGPLHKTVDVPESPDVVVGPAASRQRRFLKNGLRWGLELVIVFIGVFAAFRLQEYRAEQEADARREQITQALVREIEDITENTRRVARQMPQMVAFYDSTIAA